MENRSRKSIFI